MECTEEDLRNWVGPMNRLNDTQVNSILQPFSQNEVKEAMFSMKPKKSLGPYGIPPVALQKLWHIVGDEIG